MGTRSPLWDNDEVKAIYAHLLETHQQLSIEYAKGIALLSAGALALSVTYLEKIVHKVNGTTLPLLYAAWGAFCVSLLTITLAAALSIDATRRALDKFEAALDGENQSRWQHIATVWLNYIAASSLVLGIVLFAFFASYTVKGITAMTEPTTPILVPSGPTPETSYVPPRIPGAPQPAAPQPAQPAAPPAAPPAGPTGTTGPGPKPSPSS